MDEVNEPSLKRSKIEDARKTETDIVTLCRVLNLAMRSSDPSIHAYCVDEILMIEFAEADYPEVCIMIVECCSQQRRYDHFIGYLVKRLCMFKKEITGHFEMLFAQHYKTIDRLELYKVKNLAEFYADLLGSDILPWSVLSNIVLSKETTTPSSRFFIADLLREIFLYRILRIDILIERLIDRKLVPSLVGIFPPDNSPNFRYAMRFFNSIKLSELNVQVRSHLKTAIKARTQVEEEKLDALDDPSFDESSSALNEISNDIRKKAEEESSECIVLSNSCRLALTLSDAKCLSIMFQ